MSKEERESKASENLADYDTSCKLANENAGLSRLRAFWSRKSKMPATLQAFRGQVDNFLHQAGNKRKKEEERRSPVLLLKGNYSKVCWGTNPCMVSNLRCYSRMKELA